MKSNDIIYADLSTYYPKRSIVFYEQVFGWKFTEVDNHFFAYRGDELVGGLYEMPDLFKQMRMPHFWMTYIQVHSASRTAAKARQLGGIVELEQSVSNFGKVALIRDPQGAGFTIYEGEDLRSTRTENKVHTLIWNELHISNAQKIIPFYEGIFDWIFHQRDSNHFEIYNSDEVYLSDAWQVPNDDKGKYEYWVCTFGVKNLGETKERILAHQGSLVVDEGERMLFTDNSGEAFFYIREV